MKWSLLTAAIGAALMVQPAAAEVVKVNFSGTFVGDFYPNGSSLTGTFSYNTDQMPLEAPEPDMAVQYAPMSLSYSVDGVPQETFAFSTTLVGEFDDTEQIFTIYGIPDTSFGMDNQFQLRFEGVGLNAITDSKLPSLSNLLKLSATASAQSLDNDTLSIARLTLTPAAVPEPASWALLVGGFALAGGTLRRRRAVPAQAAAA